MSSPSKCSYVLPSLLSHSSVVFDSLTWTHVEDFPHPSSTCHVHQHQLSVTTRTSSKSIISKTYKANVPLHLLGRHNIDVRHQHRCIPTYVQRRSYRSAFPQLRLRKIKSQGTHRRVPTAGPDCAEARARAGVREWPNKAPKEYLGPNTDTNLVAQAPAIEDGSDTVQDKGYSAEIAHNADADHGLNLKVVPPKSLAPPLEDVPLQTPKASSAPQLTHLTSTGEAHMVDISHKKETARSATARSTLHFGNKATLGALVSSTVNKGDALAVARVAGIQAAKKTSDIIPLAHPGLSLTHVSIDIDVHSPASPKNYGHVVCSATASCVGKTGVEMEAITAATVTALTLFDMLKGVDKAMRIGSIHVAAKSGGKSGDWSRNGAKSQIQEVSTPSETTSKTPLEISSGTPSAFAPMQSEGGKSNTSPTKSFEGVPLDPRLHKRVNELEYLSLRQRELDFERRSAMWQEKRLKHEKEALRLDAEIQFLEERKLALSNYDIESEIQKGVEKVLRDRKARLKNHDEPTSIDTTDGEDANSETLPHSSPFFLQTSKISHHRVSDFQPYISEPSDSTSPRDFVSGNGQARPDAEDFGQRRLDRYMRWIEER